MRMINRLIEPTSGTIELDGRNSGDEPGRTAAPIGYVIQRSACSPRDHRRNVATVPACFGWDKRRNSGPGQPPLGTGRAWMRPSTAGGTRASSPGASSSEPAWPRALAADPPVLLMDETLWRHRPDHPGPLQGEFLRLQDDLNKTVVFVTHDIEEAVRLGDGSPSWPRAVHLQQYDTPAKVLGSRHAVRR